MLLCSQLLLDNSCLHSAKVGLLSDPAKNSLYIVLTYFISSLSRRKPGVQLYCLLIVTCLSASIRWVPALTNTMFLIHPVLLYFSFSLFLNSSLVGKGGARSVLALLVLLAMFLGGYWSLQELNWGGWWNWDVLECGIGFIFIFIALTLHSEKFVSLAYARTRVGISVVIALLYTVLNKSGVATSIHSFVGSEFIKSHYCVCVVILFAIWILVALRYFFICWFWVMPLVSLYLHLRVAEFLKPAVIISAILPLFYSAQSRSAVYIQHRLLFTASALILVFNYRNVMSFSHLVSDGYRFCNIDWLQNLPAVNKHSSALYRFISGDIILIKPRYNWSCNFSASAKRSLGLKSPIIGFVK